MQHRKTRTFYILVILIPEFWIKKRTLSLVLQCRLKLLVHLPRFCCGQNADSICSGLTAVNNNYGWGKNKLSSFSMADGSVKYMHRTHNDEFC